MLAVAVAAYLAAAGVYGLIETVTSIPTGAIWNEAVKAPATFVLMLAAMVAFLAPLFREETDSATRQFCAVTSVLFVAYALLKFVHVGEPDAPLQAIARYVIEPLRQSILH
ncbi:MAG: hypothetical protein WAJ85_08230 [Candidatus Baltobacteraceae bacterium]|jgi:hypothetical protein